jgi:hypothetical protein
LESPAAPAVAQGYGSQAFTSVSGLARFFSLQRFNALTVQRGAVPTTDYRLPTADFRLESPAAPAFAQGYGSQAFTRVTGLVRFFSLQRFNASTSFDLSVSIFSFSKSPC